jgi:hypothetical protein
MRLKRVVTELPAGFDVLGAEARAEGYRHIERLADEWIAGALWCDHEGEALMAATPGLELAGSRSIPHSPGALRMRRFYVRAAFPPERDPAVTRRELACPGTHVRSYGHRQCSGRKRAVLTILGFRRGGPQWAYPCLE